MSVSPISASGTRVACVQFEPVVGEKQHNIELSLTHIESAAKQGAQLIVMPELCNSGYMFKDRREAFSLAETIPTGPTCIEWLKAASRLGVTIVAGIAERDGDVLYNSAVVLGPDGYIGTFRKMHLWDSENLYFEPGNLGFPVFNTPFGRLGVAICYDIWFPETFRIQAMKGADIVCVPTNWVPIPGQAEGRDAMATVLAMAAAHSNSIFIACADRIGHERTQPFIGQSVIVGCTGWPVAGPASVDQEEIILADIELGEARKSRNWNDFNQILRDRRTDVYDEMLGNGGSPGWY
jgi:predicted amidohydrolase